MTDKHGSALKPVLLDSHLYMIMSLSTAIANTVIDILTVWLAIYALHLDANMAMYTRLIISLPHNAIHSNISSSAFNFTTRYSLIKRSLETGDCTIIIKRYCLKL